MNNTLIKKLLLNVMVPAAMTGAIGITALTGAVYSPAANAYTVYCTNCSTMMQQGMQYAKEVETALNTAQQLQYQIQSYQNMVKQGMSLPDRLYNSVTSDLQSVANVYHDARSLGRQVSNMDTQFRQQFPGFDDYLKKMGYASDVMPERYKSWSEEGLDNARTAMSAAGMNTGTFEEEDNMVNQMVARSQSAAGRLQAIQAGNEIAAQNVQQLQKLRDLVATQITLQGNYMAQQQERASVDDALRMQRRSAPITNTGTDKEY
ncbi:P-type conjugative transfer protein TrbJ [Salmonella enterica subsp. enterica serovar Enteritidis]|nr:P-type conjugative transfer protein TrbJ [Salmonella enterica subsp. enterica serovar Enteritidis]HAO0780914.1 P-type conjugative transfer protein TrbJ [Escherichia coli]